MSSQAEAPARGTGLGSGPGSGSTATHWGMVLAVVGAGVIAACQVGKAAVAVPVLRAELGLSLFASGWIISLLNLIAVLGGMAAGALADRLGHRRMMLAGLALIALANLAGGFAPGAWAIFLSRFVEGWGFVAIIVSVPSLIVQLARPLDLKLVLSVWGCYMPVGASAMILVSPLVLAPLGWRGLWWGNALLAAAYALMLAAVTRRALGGSVGRPAASPRTGDDMRRTITSAGPLALALCFMTYSANWLAVMGFLPTFLIEQLGLSAAATAPLTALAFVVNAGGNLLSGWLLHRGTARWRLAAVALLAMAATSLVIYGAAMPDAVRYLACLVFSCMGGMLPAAMFSAAPYLAPSPAHVGATNGLIIQGANLGQMAGPPVLAALIALFGGWQGSPAFVVASSTLGLGFALWLRRLERKRA